MRIIVTGASGYVGGTILRHLRLQGHHVVAWCRRPCAPPWHHHDLAAPPAADAWQSCDALIHAAHDFSARDWDEELRRNVLPSVSLLHAARQEGVPRILLISSMSAYPAAPTRYGRSKYAVETRCTDLGITVIRPGLVWGPHAGGMFGKIRSFARNSPLIPCPWSSSGLHQYLVHEEDLAGLVSQWLVACPACPGRTFSACHPTAVPFAAVVREALRLESRPTRLIPVPARLAAAALRFIEKSAIRLPFGSDNLAGLIHAREPLPATLPEDWNPRPFPLPAPSPSS